METRKRSLRVVEMELENDAELGITSAHARLSRLEFDTQAHGKWTAEEEARANQLVADFETGTLQDCENGTTLRSYLARKLNCAPMRISKKFAGRCIGKVREFVSTMEYLTSPHHIIPSSCIAAVFCAPRGRRIGPAAAAHG